MIKIADKLYAYARLMRLHKPIGILLLLWPTLWALWLAGAGKPAWRNVIIFIIGVVIMRSAGCVINDFADRNFDAHVARTRTRPLATGQVTSKEALILFILLSLSAFILVLLLNWLTILLAIIGIVITVIYPFLKRVTHLPQLGLGVAFSWGVPMAFAAQQGRVPAVGWLIFFIGCLWPVAYDTIYAMVDREDDKRIGIKSTAILFANSDKLIIGLLQLLIILLLIVLGIWQAMQWVYYAGLFLAASCFIYQQYLIKDRNEQYCWRAFLNNNWVGLFIFLGFLLNYYAWQWI